MTSDLDIFARWFILTQCRSSSKGQGHGSKFKVTVENIAIVVAF